jgi:hypothetical protein
MSAHTLEPWVLVGQRVTAKSPTGNGKTIVVAESNDWSDGDGRLIAAAPDLLAALKRLTDRVDPATKADRSITSFSQAIDAARSAIAKAEGKS